MSLFGQLQLQQALLVALQGDSMLMGLVSGVFDRVPQGTQFPYIAIGGCKMSDRSTKTSDGGEYWQDIEVWSRDNGRKEILTVMARVHMLLHNADLAVSGYHLVSLRCDASDTTIENDGHTYKGVMHFRAILHAN